jgi:hypothetical protein
MKMRLSFLIAGLAWFAIAAQYYVVLQNTTSTALVATIRFFSYFTVLTNTIVALYFTFQVIGKSNALQRFFGKPGTLTAITAYILVVGIVYQIILRQLWNPEGLQMISDELLHTILPLGTLLFWLLYEEKGKLQWKSIGSWLIYPLIYLLYTLIRGNISGEYPYPFVDVTELGIQKAMFNSLAVFLLFVLLSSALIWIGKRFGRETKVDTHRGSE